MIKFLKARKSLAILLITVIVSVLIGLLLPSLLPDDIKKEVLDNILKLENGIINNTLSTSISTKTIFIENLSFLFLFWILGISIIGIPIILFLYISKVVVASMEFCFLMINLSKIHIGWIPFYFFPSILNLFIYFILVYYALNYSILLIKLLFFKKEYNMKIITKRYLKVLLFCLILILLSTLLETLLIPRILNFLF